MKKIHIMRRGDLRKFIENEPPAKSSTIKVTFIEGKETQFDYVTAQEVTEEELEQLRRAGKLIDLTDK